VLQEELFYQGWPVSMVSATLTTNGNFNFIRQETGVPKEALELVAESPFNFRRQALLVVPEELVEPNSPSFPGIASRLIERVIRMCNGRTLGLFTSYKNMRATHERIQNLPYTVLKQGDAPRTELVRKFKSDVHSVLLGTTSFWTGVDVSGEALTGLVIDRLPFPNPDDPIIDAITERDKNAFSNYMVPQAIIALRQGVGRLIRSIDDVGVVVILDVRVATKGYGKRFLNSLPDMRSTRDVEAIETFLAEANEL
jgi:ATP-dependent DNA helicase DinG